LESNSTPQLAAATYFFVLVFSTILLFFSFEGLDYTIDLHSFPTRRSSDLLSDPGSLAIDPFVQGSIENRHNVARVGKNGIGEIADRKSTRLNSSHEWISYAVFCLKKKNEIKVFLIPLTSRMK